MYNVINHTIRRKICLNVNITKGFDETTSQTGLGLAIEFEVFSFHNFAVRYACACAHTQQARMHVCMYAHAY